MFADKSFVLVTHRFFPTLADDLKDFLVSQKSKYVYFIAHEFAALLTRRSFIETYNASATSQVFTPDFRWLPESVIYIKDLLVTTWWLLTRVKRVDVYVGYGAFNVLPALLMRQLLGLKKIIFYTVDLAPNRFSNPLLNKVYRWVDKVAMRGSDEVWNLSPRMAEGREKLWGLKRSEFQNQVVVPLGIWLKATPEIKTSHTLFFSGHLMEKQGLQLVIQALPAVVKKIPDAKLLIVGEGEYKQNLVDLVNQLNLKKHVTFAGKISNSEQMKLMHTSGAALAPYVPSADNFSIYADSAKLKTYLSAGLPIVLTNVTYNAQELQRKECAIVVEYDVQDLTNAAVKVISDAKLQRFMKQNALRYIKNYDWNKIFNANFKRILA